MNLQIYQPRHRDVPKTGYGDIELPGPALNALKGAAQAFCCIAVMSTVLFAQSPSAPAPASPENGKAAAGPSDKTDPWPAATPSGIPDIVEPPPSPNLPAGAVALASARAQDRWKAIVAGNFDAAFAFFSDASKANYSSTDLQRHWAQFSPTAARVHEARCSGEVCTIFVFVDGSVRLPRVGLTQQLVPSIERWAWDGKSFSLLRK